VLAALRAQWPGGGPLPAVCCDDGSESPLESAFEAPAGVRFLRLSDARGPAAARNAAWRSVDADWVWFLDDDVLPEPGAVREMLAAVTAAADRVGIIEGPVRAADVPASQLANPLVPRVPEGGDSHRLTANIAYRRRALAGVGGFDEGFPAAACEDFDLAFRVEDAGWRHAFAPGAAVRHAVHPPLSARAWWRLRRLRRAAVVRLYTRHPGRFGPSWVSRVGPLLGKSGDAMTPAVFARFFVLEALMEAVASRRAWRFPRLLLLSWLLAIAAIAGTVIDGLTGAFTAAASTAATPGG